MAILLPLLLAVTSNAVCPPSPPLDYAHHQRDLRNYIGLLSSPGFFPYQPCTARIHPVDVFASPSKSHRVAQLRRTTVGGYCQAVVHTATNSSVAECPRSDLPVDEYSYEEKGFIVLEMVPGWVRIRLVKGSGWIRREPGSELHRYEDLGAAMGFLSNDWNGALFRAPNGKSWKPKKATDRSIEMIDVKRLNGTLWFKVRLLERTPCSDKDPATVAVGWVRAYDAHGSPIVGYYPRGC